MHDTDYGLSVGGGWPDSWKKTHDAIMGKADEDMKRILQEAGVANVISREGLPALVVFDGKIERV